MIHVALFSFQRTTLSFEALASSDLFIVPHLFQTVKNFFIFSFYLIDGHPACPARLLHSRNTFSLSLHVGLCLAATCNILQGFRRFVNTLFIFFYILRTAEAIARASHGLDVVRMRRIRFDLLPDPVDMHGYRGTVPQCIDPPDPFKEPFS